MKAAADGTTGKWENVAKDMGDAATAVGLETTPAQYAWLLIYNALTQAIFTLVDEHREYFLDPPDNTELELLNDEIDDSLEQSEVCIDRSLFDRPKDLPVIESIKPVFLRWMTKGFGMNKAQAQSLTARLPGYFVFALHDQWRSRRTCMNFANQAKFCISSPIS